MRFNNSQVSFSEIKVEEAHGEELQLFYHYLQNNSPDDEVELLFLAALICNAIWW